MLREISGWFFIGLVAFVVYILPIVFLVLGVVVIIKFVTRLVVKAKIETEEELRRKK